MIRLYRVPSYFGEVSAEEVEKITQAMSDYYRYINEFQNREKSDSENDSDCENTRRLVRGPRLKSCSFVRLKE